MGHEAAAAAHTTGTASAASHLAPGQREEVQLQRPQVVQLIQRPAAEAQSLRPASIYGKLPDGPLRYGDQALMSDPQGDRDAPGQYVDC